MERFRGLLIGIQSWTLRNFELPDAIKIVKDLGLKFFEMGKLGIPGVGPDDPEKAMRSIEYCRKEGIESHTISGNFSDEVDKEIQRPVFELARLMGIGTVIGPPKVQVLPVLDELAQEYQINVALHNHGPGGELSDIDTIGKILEPHSPRIGLCVDTGHYLRLPLDPIAVLKSFKPRIHAIHLRDMDPDKDPIKGDGSKYVEYAVGEGPLDLEGFLRLMLEWRYDRSIALEYKPNADNPVPDMQQALSNIERTLERI